MAESDSSRNSSYSSSNSEDSSTEASEDLYLSLLAEVSPYRFKQVYDVGKEPSSSSVPTETEDLGVSRVGNTDW